MSNTEPETVVTVTYYDTTGYPIGTVGRYGTDWWGSANGDVQGFPDEAAAETWVLEQIAGNGTAIRRDPPKEA